MLDIFGNVFGRKKDKSGANIAINQSPSSQRRESGVAGAAGEADDFLFVSQPGDGQSPGVYPIILKDDMLRSPPGQASNVSTWNSHYQATAVASASYENVAAKANTNQTPIDNVPFAASTSSQAARLNHGTQLTDLGKSFQVVDRVGVFLSTPSQSDYNFSLENTVIREVAAAANAFPFN